MPELLRAEMLLGASNASGAIAHARRVLKKDDAHVGALEILAKGLWQTCHFEELSLTLRRLIELNPYEPGYHVLQAAAYQSLGRCGEAMKSYLRAAELGGSPSVDIEEVMGELQKWQGGLVESLLHEDPRFRVEYAQDPEAACRARGFAFRVDAASNEGWIRHDRESRVAAYARPS